MGLHNATSLEKCVGRIWNKRNQQKKIQIFKSYYFGIKHLMEDRNFIFIEMFLIQKNAPYGDRIME